MRSLAGLLVGVLTLHACGGEGLDLAKAIVIAEEHEASARRELVRLERQLANGTGDEAKIAAQRDVVRAAEVQARSLRIQSKQ